MSPTSAAPSRLWPLWAVLLAAAGTAALTMGSRSTMGLFISPINTATQLGLANISLAFAFGQLWWGITQPFAGAMADRLGAGRVLVVGVLLVALGSFITPWMTSTAGLIFAIGVLAAGGAGMCGPAVLMASAIRKIPERSRGMATGIINAGSSTGQFVMAPIAGALLIGLGHVGAIQVLGLLVLLALPAAWVLGGRPPSAPLTPAAAPAAAPAASPQTSATSAPVATPATSPQAPLTTRAAIAAALRHPSYLMLAAGFFVCGFHVAFLSTHLPGVIAACGLPVQYGAWSLAMLGLFNIAGSLAMGWAVGRWRMKSLLSLVYAARALAVLVFLLAPKTGPGMLLFAAVMGLTFLSTIPPTAGLVAKFFGTRHMATLFGVVMLTHQVGGFLGAWLGGKVFDATGSFDLVWIIDIALAVAAALIHLPIREAHPVRAVAA